MLIDRNTQISQLRYFGILDNVVFSILRSNGYRNVGDILNSKDFDSLGIKDYVVKSLKSFLRQMVIYEEPLEKIREDIKFHRNPQLEQAVEQTFADEEMVKAKEEGKLIFNDFVDVVSFIQIATDDEYFKWLDDRSMSDETEQNALYVSFSFLKKLRENIAALNRYNMYLRVIDQVVRFDRFRDVARQYNAEHKEEGANTVEERPFKPQTQHFQMNRERPVMPEPRVVAPITNVLIPFKMIDDEEEIAMAKKFLSENGYYPMFSILISYLKKAKVVGTVRLASVAGVHDSMESDDWTKKEARRRYIDGVNRGLGLPADAELQTILMSEQWSKYKLDKYKYFSEKNFPFKELCEKENLNVSFSLIAFLISIVRKMAMVNIQFKKPVEDAGPLFADSDENSVYTYVVPVEFTNFLYTSFVTVTNNKKQELTNREVYKDYLRGTLSKRYWRGETLTGDCKLFLTIVKDIIADILGMYADDKSIVSEIDLSKPVRAVKKMKTEKLANAQRKTRKYSKRTGKMTILQAVKALIKGHHRPMTSKELVEGVKALGASNNETSIKVTLSIGRRSGKLIFFDDGTIDLAHS